MNERYAIPPSSPATITYTGLPLDEIEDALQRSVAMQNARGILAQAAEDVRSACYAVSQRPRWIVGLQPHAERLLRGRRNPAHRTLAIGQICRQFNEEGEAEGETIIRKRERFSHELTLAYESGQIIELKETKDEVRNKSPYE